MKAAFATLGAFLLLSSAPVLADDPEPHLAKAKEAAGFEFTGTLARICAREPSSVGSGSRGVIPDSAVWHAEPARMFDHLHFIGTRVPSACGRQAARGRRLI